MSELVRISMSLEKPLLDKLDVMIEESKYTNRSEFVRDMIRERIVEEEWEQDRKVVGSITLVYNHHFRMLSEKLTDMQHDYHAAILATTHVHLDEDMCVEIILVKARAAEARTIADLLRQQKGVLHAALSMTSTGKRLS